MPDCSARPTAEAHPAPEPKPRLLVTSASRFACALQPRTEEAYVGWVRRFILFHGKRQPADMGAAEISQSLSHLAAHERVSASTRNQALSGLAFLNRLRGAPRKRLSLATHLLEDGYDIRTVQALLGHRDVRTTMIHNARLEPGWAEREDPWIRL